MLTKEEIKHLIMVLEKDILTEKDEKKINQFFFSYPTSLEEEVDLILVLSSSAMERIKKAVELSKKWKTPILISGSNYVEKDQMLEDERYYLYAVSHGIEDIILENNSHNTKENMIESIKILKKKKVKRIALVTSSQHMLRAILTFQKEQKKRKLEDILLFPVCCYASKVPKGKWIDQKDAKEIIKGELKRLVKYRLIK